MFFQVTSKKAALIEIHGQLGEKIGATALISRGKLVALIRNQI